MLPVVAHQHGVAHHLAQLSLDGLLDGHGSNVFTSSSYHQFLTNYSFHCFDKGKYTLDNSTSSSGRSLAMKRSRLYDQDMIDKARQIKD